MILMFRLHMFGVARKVFKIAKSIISPIMVFVVNYLGLIKKSAEVFLHDNPMFRVVAFGVGFRMPFSQKHDITSSSYNSTPIPHRMFGTNKCSTSPNTVTFSRASNSFFNRRLRKAHWLGTYFTFLINVTTLPINSFFTNSMLRVKLTHAQLGASSRFWVLKLTEPFLNNNLGTNFARNFNHA